jgi:hypothetical protein
MAMTSEADARRDALIERLMRSTGGMFDIYTTYLGHRLGLYQPLSVAGGCTSSELARRTGTHERFVREWLEQQTVIGTLEVDDARSPPSDRRYCLPSGHAEVLVARDSTNYLAPLAQLMVGAVHRCRPYSKRFAPAAECLSPTTGPTCARARAD